MMLPGTICPFLIARTSFSPSIGQSVSCFFIRKGYRRQGLSVKLLEAVKKHVRASGGKLIEGYPGATDAPDTFSWTGRLPAFERAGFEEVARPGARAIVRINLPSRRKP